MDLASSSTLTDKPRFGHAVTEIASGLGRHTATVYTWIKAGVIGPDGNRVFLKAQRIGGRLYVPEANLQRFIDELNPPPGPATVAAASSRNHAAEAEALGL